MQQSTHPMAAIGIPPSMYADVEPPILEDGVVIFEGTPVMWDTLSSYCGKFPPATLDLNGTINWLEQKTRIVPCRTDLSKEENSLRYAEYRQMKSLKMVLQMRRLLVE